MATIIENAKNSKTKENQLMLLRLSAVLGLTKVPYLTREFWTKRQERICFVVQKYQ